MSDDRLKRIAPLALKITAITLSSIFLISQIVAFCYGCKEKDALFILPTILGIITGVLGIWAGFKENKKGMIAVVILGVVLVVCYALLLAKSGKSQDDEKALSLKETKYKCCGTNGPTYYTNKNVDVPETCYPSGKEGDKNSLYQKGCDEFTIVPLSELSWTGFLDLIIMSIVLALLVIIFFFTFFCLTWCCLPCCLACCLICIEDAESRRERRSNRQNATK